MARIALVGDGTLWRIAAAEGIRSMGHTVMEFGSNADLRASAFASTPEILVIDRALPDGDGLDIAITMAHMHPEMGLVVLTANNSLSDRLQALKYGADHSLSKPVELAELKTIVESLARRLKVATGWKIDHENWHLFTPEGNPISLTAQEYLFLCELNKNPSKNYRRADILLALGKSDRDYNSRSLDALVLRLRKKPQLSVNIQYR